MLIPFKLGKRRKVSINNFKGRLLVDIREYYETDDGTEKPGKKGEFSLILKL